MPQSSVVRTFEIRAVRPLWLATIAATFLAGFTRHWWSVGAGLVALFIFGLIGASLHPLQSGSDLAKGQLEGPVGQLRAASDSRRHSTSSGQQSLYLRRRAARRNADLGRLCRSAMAMVCGVAGRVRHRCIHRCDTEAGFRIGGASLT